MSASHRTNPPYYSESWTIREVINIGLSMVPQVFRSPMDILGRLNGLEKTTPGTRTRAVTSSPPVGALFLPTVAAYCVNVDFCGELLEQPLVTSRYLPLVGLGKRFY